MAEVSGSEARSAQRVLLIDDQPEFGADLASMLVSDFAVELAPDADAGLRAFNRERPDAVLLDLDLGTGLDGLEVLVALRDCDNLPPIIMLTGERRVDVVVRAIRLGAYDYLTKPPDLDLLLRTLRRAIGDQVMRRRLRSLERELAHRQGPLVTADRRMLLILDQIEKVAPTEATVLITGESGTGKELVARQVHDRSQRRDGPFVAVNCAAVPADLIESELFGHEAGAFTGADRRRRGVFEQAAGGTLFLDELGDSPASLQVKLLRVLEERSFRRVGGDAVLRADVRLVAATSKDIEAQVQRQELREELYYRLNVFRVNLPPLRERGDDVPLLVQRFLGRFAAQQGKTIDDVDPLVLEMLQRRDWPGNVRQLRNAVERAVILCDGPTLEADHFFGLDQGLEVPVLPYDLAKQQALERFKHAYIAARMRESAGNLTQAAELSGLKRQSFQRMVSELGLDPATFRRTTEN